MPKATFIIAEDGQETSCVHNPVADLLDGEKTCTRLSYIDWNDEKQEWEAFCIKTNKLIASDKSRDEVRRLEDEYFTNKKLED